MLYITLGERAAEEKTSKHVVLALRTPYVRPFYA
jgi:hypothetical protein